MAYELGWHLNGCSNVVLTTLTRCIMYLLLIKRHVNSQYDLQTYARVYVVALTRNGLSNATVSQLAELNTVCL